MASETNSAPPTVAQLFIAKTHYRDLKSFLREYLIKEQDGGVSMGRSSARDKLTKLFAHQFEELSTDVYDEMKRRIVDDSTVPFLPVKDDYHPKRNQARQKLATLSNNRFKDLSSDVFRELERRYPQIIREVSDSESYSLPSGSQSPIPEKQRTFPRPPKAATVNEASTPSSKPSSAQHSPAASLKRAPPPLPESRDRNQTQKKDQVSAPASNSSTLNKTPSQQPLAADRTDPFGVNFQTLDNVMADLGDLLLDKSPVDHEEDKTLSRAQTNPMIEAPIAPVNTVDSTLNHRGGAQESSMAPQVPFPPVPVINVSNDSAAEDALKSENRRLKEDCQSLEEQLNTIRLEFAKLQSENMRNVRDLEASNNEVKQIQLTHEETLKSFQEELTKLHSEIETSKPDKYLREIEQLKAALKESERTRADLEVQLRKREKETRELTDQLSKEQQLSKSMRVELEELQEKVEALRQSNEEKEQNLLRERNRTAEQKQQHLLLQHAALASNNNSIPASKSSVINDYIDSGKNEPGAIGAPSVEIPRTKSISGNASNKPATPSTSKQHQDTSSIMDTINSIVSRIKIGDRQLYSVSGHVHKSNLNEFHQAMFEMLKATVTSTPADVLIAMKSIVVSTRAISDCLDRFEQEVGGASGSVGELKNGISASLTGLMGSAKNYATGQQPTSESIFEQAGVLVSSVMSVVELLQITEVLQREELRTFLERQTDLIVQNIQILLQAMRQASFGPEFQTTITNITSVVDNLVRVTRTSLESTEFKQKSDKVLDNLSESNRKLSGLGEELGMGDKKPSKQKLAGAAYEVAKYTKEVVSLFDSE